MASKPIVRDFIGAVLQAIVGCLCAGQALAAPRWDLTVTLNPSTEQLTVRGCSNQGQARVHLWAGPTAAHFLRGSRRGDAKLETGASSFIHFDDWQAGECYHVDVDLKAAGTADRWGLGRMPDRYWRVPPSLWLWRPQTADAASTLRFEFPEGWSESVPWTPLAGAAHRYRLGSTPTDWPAQTAFGRFEEQTLALTGGQLRVSVLPTVDASDRQQISDWFRATAPALLANDGRLPLPDTQVLIVPLPGVAEPIPWGQVSRGGAAAVTLFVGMAAGRAGWQGDWTATHELAHLMHPFLGDRGRWLAEGLASYYQNVWRARRGDLTPSEAWRRLDAGFGRGRAVGKGAPLRELSMARGAVMRLYWSGAAFWLEADLALRRQGSSLDQQLARFRDEHLPSERYWPPEDFIGALDRRAPQAGLRRLYERYAALTDFPDLSAAYRELGLTADAVPDGDLPPQPLRDAIMASR